MTCLEEIGTSPEDNQEQSVDEDNSDEEIDLELRRQIEDLQTILISLKAQIIKKETEIVKKGAKIDQTRKRVKNAERLAYYIFAVLLLVIAVGTVGAAFAIDANKKMQEENKILNDKYEKLYLEKIDFGIVLEKMSKEIKILDDKNKKANSKNIDFGIENKKMKEEEQKFKVTINQLNAEKNYLDQRLSDLESDRQFWREKHEFREREMVAKWIQAQDEEKRNKNYNKNFDLCISAFQMLKNAVKFVIGWIPGALIKLSILFIFTCLVNKLLQYISIQYYNNIKY